VFGLLLGRAAHGQLCCEVCCVYAVVLPVNMENTAEFKGYQTEHIVPVSSPAPPPPSEPQTSSSLLYDLYRIPINRVICFHKVFIREMPGVL
jgi:hypothetical protein